MSITFLTVNVVCFWKTSVSNSDSLLFHKRSHSTQYYLVWTDVAPATTLIESCWTMFITTIDDSTPVSQSRHTLRFQPIACCSIIRCPHVLTRPEMVWQAFMPDIARSQLAVFDMAEKTPGKRNCCYGQCKSDERYPVKCAGVIFKPLPKPKTRLKDRKTWIKARMHPHTLWSMIN